MLKWILGKRTNNTTIEKENEDVEFPQDLEKLVSIESSDEDEVMKRSEDREELEVTEELEVREESKVTEGTEVAEESEVVEESEGLEEVNKLEGPMDESETETEEDILARKEKRIKVYKILGVILLLILIIVFTIAYNILKPGWKINAEGSQYKSAETKEFLIGLHEIDDEFFIFGEDTYLQFGWLVDGDNKYYAEEDGALVKGEVIIDEVTYHFDEVLSMLLLGWVDKNGERFFYNEDTSRAKGMVEIEELFYYFEEDTYAQYIGLYTVEESGNLYVFTEEGIKPGIIEWDGNKYIVNENYTLETGMVKFEDERYNLSIETGEMLSGWYEKDKSKYYFDDETFLAVSGWYTVDDIEYYFMDDNTIAIGMKTVGDEKYYFKDGVVQKGWQTIDNVKYYFSKDNGVAVSGWQTIDSVKYHFTSEGTPSSGQLKISGKAYYFKNGIAQSGWITVGSKKYYYINGGGTYSGSQTIDGKSYYFVGDGYLAEGWTTINGVKYYYKDNKKVTTTTTISGKTYYFNSDGTITTGWKTVNGNKYYYSQYGSKLTGWQTISGNKYYFDSEGVMATSTSRDGYNINSSGVATLAPIDSSTLGSALDKLLNQYGKSLSGACTAARSTISYKSMSSQGSTSANAIYALNNKRGSCYMYASLTYELFKRMGYSPTYIVGVGRNAPNAHAWVGLSVNGEMKYYDSLYGSNAFTADELKNLGYSW